MNSGAFLGCGLMLLVASGCATPTAELKLPHAYGRDAGSQQLSWHQLRFKWAWPEGQAPDWFLDPLIADMVLSGIITDHQESLPLWRFHRRAARTPSGHQFSFIFYSTPEAARTVRASAAAHGVTQRLLAQGTLEDLHLTRPENPAALPATSDPGWPEPVQTTWPMFIMGVSQTWLGLVELHAGDTAELQRDLDEAVAHYETVNDTINELWYHHAQHAFFHHLSGVFGYEPVRFRKRIRF